MTGLQNYQHWAYEVPAGEEVKISTSGHYIVCLEATAAFEIGVDGARGQFLEAGLGFFMPQGEEFQNVIVTNSSAAPNIITLAIGRGNFKDSRLSLNGKVSLSDVTIAALRAVPATLEDAATVTIATATIDAIAPTANQREILIQASPDNTANLRVGATNATGRGLWLAPGQSVSLATAATAYVSNDTGGSLDYSWVKVVD